MNVLFNKKTGCFPQPQHLVLLLKPDDPNPNPKPKCDFFCLNLTKHFAA